MTGLVLKGVGSFYTVLTQDGERYVCKARGRFRNTSITPLPGDRVEFAFGKPEGYILNILERKSLLMRPAVANIDRIIIVLSASVPKPDLLLCDKLLITCEMSAITPIIVINKCDEQPNVDFITDQYADTGYSIAVVSAHTGVGLDMLYKLMKGYICCFAGQSAVGKSSLLNALIPGLTLETGELSRKTERGKHTTRHAELIPVANDTILVDTPGFSLLDASEVEPAMLCRYYPDMKPYLTGCRYPSCLHISEPDCSIISALERNCFNKQRYQRYVYLVNELMERKKHKYD